MREFHLSTILSVTTGILFCEDGMGSIYEILNYMTGSNLYTHELPMAMRDCTPYILKQHPYLANSTGEGVTEHNWKEYLNHQIGMFGEYLYIKPLPKSNQSPLKEEIGMSVLEICNSCVNRTNCDIKHMGSQLEVSALVFEAVECNNYIKDTERESFNHYTFIKNVLSHITLALNSGYEVRTVRMNPKAIEEIALSENDYVRSKFNDIYHFLYSDESLPKDRFALVLGRRET